MPDQNPNIATTETHTDDLDEQIEVNEALLTERSEGPNRAPSNASTFPCTFPFKLGEREV
jgi:hypothetical protein